jgi:hypothetical protein
MKRGIGIGSGFILSILFILLSCPFDSQTTA